MAMLNLKRALVALMLLSSAHILNAQDEEKASEVLTDIVEINGILDAKKSQSVSHAKPANTIKERLTRLEQDASNLQRDFMRQVEALEKELEAEFAKKKQVIEQAYLIKLQSIHDEIQDLLKASVREFEEEDN
jgi:hypothetical protein